MGSFLQHPAVLIFVASVLFLMALNFFGLWELRLPSFLSSAVSKSHTGYAQSLFMGLTLGIVAAPCIGPFIIGLLTMVAQKGDPLYRFSHILYSEHRSRVAAFYSVSLCRKCEQASTIR